MEYRSTCEHCNVPHISGLHRCGVPRTLLGKRLRFWASEQVTDTAYQLVEAIDRIELALHREAVTSGRVVSVKLGTDDDGGTYAYLPKDHLAEFGLTEMAEDA